MQPQRGFTLIELLVVLVIIAIAAVSVTLSVRDTQADLLQRDRSEERRVGKECRL